MTDFSKIGHSMINEPVSCSHDTTDVISNSSSCSRLIQPLNADKSIKCDERLPLLGKKEIVLLGLGYISCYYLVCLRFCKMFISTVSFLLQTHGVE